MSSRVADGMRLSAGTLTALPVSAPARVDRSRAAVAMSLAPIAAFPLGAGVAAIAYGGVRAGLPSLVIATLALVVLTLGSRAMHLDGLADTADGFTASYDRDRALDVMHRGDVGPAGTSAVVLVLVLQVAALSSVVTRPWGWLLAGVLVCASRAALALTCVRGVPAARPGGLGAAVAGTVPRPVSVLVWCACTALVSGALVLSGRPVWHGVATAGAAVAAVAVLVARSRRRLGGVTGDVLGAAIEIALCALFVGAAA